MRSVFIHFPQTSEPAVRRWLTGVATQIGIDRWNAPPDAPVLYLSICDPEDLDPATRAAVGASIGAPAVCLQVDLSGRANDDEVRRLILAASGAGPEARFSDDYTGHLWHWSEICGGTLVQGHGFFDHAGWYAATLARSPKVGSDSK